ncbi:MAG: prolyl oligopeptidase family serine peptidase [Planctomycetales bacterium]
MTQAQDAEGHFKSAPTTSERIRADAKAAPLAMRFDGSTPDDLAEWQKKFGSQLKSLLGPHRPPEEWETIVEHRQEFDDFVRERLVLKAEGHSDLPLYRLLPNPLPEKPCPGAVAIHGHSGVFPVVGLREAEGKLEEAPPNHYDYGRDLARRGYIVVAPCMTPFHPREPREGYPAGSDRCAVTFVRMQLLGKLLIAENLRDCLWCVEMLAQDARVDAERLGCLGLSYGGRMTMLTTALEPRIRVAAISGAANVMQERIQLRYSCGAQVIPGLLQYGDVPEIGSLIAPRPCVWEIGSRDGLIDPNWANEAMQRIDRAYRAAGAADNLYVDRFEGGHIFHGKVTYPLFDKILRPGK